MRKFKVSVVRRQIKHVIVLAEDELSANSVALNSLIGEEFSHCYVEYSIDKVVPAGEGEDVDIKQLVDSDSDLI